MADYFGLQHIASGDLVRDEMRKGTEIGKEASRADVMVGSMQGGQPPPLHVLPLLQPSFACLLRLASMVCPACSLVLQTAHLHQSSHCTMHFSQSCSSLTAAESNHTSCMLAFSWPCLPWLVAVMPLAAILTARQGARAVQPDVSAAPGQGLIGPACRWRSA